MDPIGTKITASHVLAQATVAELADIFKRYGDVSEAHRLAEKLVKYKQTQPLVQVGHLREAVFQFMDQSSNDSKYNMLSRVFQALRIFINNESGNLDSLIESIPSICNYSPLGSKVPFLGLILTFHSQEHQVAMAALGKLRKSQEKVERGFEFLERGLRPTSDEVARNSPSRSASLIAFELNGTKKVSKEKGLLTESRHKQNRGSV